MPLCQQDRVRPQIYMIGAELSFEARRYPTKRRVCQAYITGRPDVRHSVPCSAPDSAAGRQLAESLLELDGGRCGLHRRTSMTAALDDRRVPDGVSSSR